jgi:hypothetical protein
MSKIESGRRIVSVKRPVCHQYKQSIEESRGKDPKHDTKVVWLCLRYLVMDLLRAKHTGVPRSISPQYTIRGTSSCLSILVHPSICGKVLQQSAFRDLESSTHR